MGSLLFMLLQSRQLTWVLRKNHGWTCYLEYDTYIYTNKKLYMNNLAWQFETFKLTVGAHTNKFPSVSMVALNSLLWIRFKDLNPSNAAWEYFGIFSIATSVWKSMKRKNFKTSWNRICLRECNEKYVWHFQTALLHNVVSRAALMSCLRKIWWAESSQIKIFFPPVYWTKCINFF